jgi:A/G-specific adenine glycosylase
MPSTLLPFTQALMRWYEKNKRDLPWRQTSDPYKIWISEIMLQQTTVNAVIPFYDRWIKEFPNTQAVAKAPLQKILKMWQGLGYYSRARNIHRTAQVILKEHQGNIPQEPEELKRLHGFGPYTIGAVLSIAFDKRHPIIDANVRRVIMRQLALEGFADTSHDKKIFEFLDKVMPQKGNNIFNQSLMELGALICRSKSPLCLGCPVRNTCLAFKKGIQESIPTPKKKIIKEVSAAIAIIENNKKYYMQKRPKGLFADLWEFPGGKIEKGESADEALYREVKEELGVEVISHQFLFNVTQLYTEFKANLHIFHCKVSKPLKEDKTHKWIGFSQIKKYPMPSGTVKILDKLKNI